MVSTITLVAHLTVALAVLLSSFDSTTANLQCKKKMMSKHMMYCSGDRARRDLTESLRKNYPKPGEVRSGMHHQLVKREVTQDSVGTFLRLLGSAVKAMPLKSGGRGDAASEIPERLAAVMDAYRTISKFVPTENTAEPQFLGGALPAQLGPMVKTGFDSFQHEVLPLAYGDDLGFDLTSEEVDEFYDMMSNRISRHSGKNPEEIRNLVMQAVAKCCSNEDTCYSELSIIPCV